ncbi:MAG: hypothetical protein ACRDUS_19525 [Mycobacterium sp.]
MEPRAQAGWDDFEQFEGVVAFSFALPYVLPLDSGVVPIGVDDEYLQIRGASPSDFDDAWMNTPFICSTLWSVESTGTDPVLESTTLASTVLARLAGQEPPPPRTKDNSHEQSVVVVLLPVKSRVAALTPPHDGKVDPLTVAHWLIADVVRSLRIVAAAPLPELHYRSLNPIVPAVFGSVSEDGRIHFNDRQTAILLDHLPARLASSSLIDHATAGNVFAQLTRGSISALIRDHFSRATAEYAAGDRRAAVLSLAITCELMLDSVLAGILWEEEKSAAQAAQQWANESSITHRVKRLYAERLGGNWHLDASGPVSNWRRHVVDVRNSVIHSGRTPSEVESHLAGTATSELLTFVTKRQIIKWKTYPKTLALLCGPTSVTQHASKKQRDAILVALQRYSPFAVAFHRWRDDWLKERALL